jgi:hypothetical protein
MSPEELWDRVRQCFERDDGSLPTIELQSLTASEIAGIYSLIREQSRVVSQDATFWDVRAAADRALDEVLNAAQLVSAGHASPFHFAVEGVAHGGTTIPCLGIQVFRDTIAVDYRMGPEWGVSRVFAFFSWLKSLIAGTRDGIVVPSSTEAPADPEAFKAAWDSFSKSEVTPGNRS